MNAGPDFWRGLFEHWPASLPRRGMLVTTFQETIPFTDFLLAQDAVLVERDRPDSHDARKIVIAFEFVAALKFTDPGSLTQFQALGFEAPA